MKFKYINKKIISVVLAGSVLCTGVPTIAGYKNNTSNISTSEIEDNSETILDLIDQNESFTLEEKEFLKSFEEFYNEKEEFFDMKVINKSLKTLEIVYSGKKDDSELAFYDLTTNKITINNFEKFGPDVERVLFHEFLHSITIGKPIDVIKGSLFEGITEAETIKYTNSEARYYKLLLGYANELRKIVGDDVINAYFYSGDEKILVKELDDIVMGKREAKDLLYSMYKHYTYLNEGNFNKAYETKKKVDDYLETYNKELTKTK